MQGQLALGAGDFVARTHINPSGKRYRHQVYLANNENGWAQRGYSIEDAIVYANDLSDQDILDCYVSANGFSWERDETGRFKGRTTDNVTDVQSLYVDFDYYRTEYAHLSVSDFARLVLDENPWLPLPTFIIASRGEDNPGCWFVWGFKKPLPLNRKTERYPFLPAWQTLQDFLIKKLKGYGADPACSDAARVVRLPGTVNSKSDAMAVAWAVNPRHDFNDLRRAFNAEYRKDDPVRKLVPESPKEAKSFRSNRGKVSNLYSWHHLAYLRRNDMLKLAEIRGGRLPDHNRMAPWIYAVVSCNYCKNEQSLRDDVEGFIRSCCSDPDTYSRTVNYESTIGRFNRWQELRQEIGQREIEKRCDDPDDPLDWSEVIYRLTRQYIVKQLEITTAEGRQLKVLFDDDEKRRRNTVARRAKRRSEGVKPQKMYLEKQTIDKDERKAEAMRLRAEGFTLRQIAEKVGVSTRTVMKYL